MGRWVLEDKIFSTVFTVLSLPRRDVKATSSGSFTNQFKWKDTGNSFYELIQASRPLTQLRFKQDAHLCFEGVYKLLNENPGFKDYLIDKGENEVPAIYLAAWENAFRLCAESRLLTVHEVIANVPWGDRMLFVWWSWTFRVMIMNFSCDDLMIDNRSSPRGVSFLSKTGTKVTCGAQTSVTISVYVITSNVKTTLTGTTSSSRTTSSENIYELPSWSGTLR